MTPAPVIRVFVSSTFIDMQEERHFLVNEVFPDIRRECARIGIDFEEIDLRWGISGETSDAEVLDYCLRQIEGCIPYLFAMIGGRYGWIPGEQVEIAAMLADHERSCSVTEIEIQRFESGVRQRSAVEPRALVGLRTDAFTTALGVQEQLAPAARQRLDALRARFAPPRHDSFDYGDLATLGAAVRAFFLAEARALASNLDSPARYIEAQQEQYLRQLRVPGVPHVPVALQARNRDREWVPADLAQLADPHADTRLHFILGAPGSGKTTLCTQLAQHWTEQHGGTVLRLHVGASGELSANGIAQDLFKLADAAETEDWADGLACAIDALAAPTLVVIDGIERMIGWNQPTCDQTSPLFLMHQPGTLLYNILFRLVEKSRATVVATLDPAAQPDNYVGWVLRDDVMCSDGPEYQVVRIRPLDSNQRRQLATQFFASRGKELTDAQVEQIGCASNLTDFDSLLLACDRMRRFGELHSSKRTQDDFVLAALHERFGQTREQTADALIAEAKRAHGLDGDSVRAALMLLASSAYGIPAPIIVELVRKHTGADFTLSNWAVLEGILGSFLIRNGTRYQFKNSGSRDMIVRALGTEHLAAARAALVDHVFDQAASMGVDQIFDTTVDALLANELPWLLRQMPGHARRCHLFQPYPLLAWNSRAPEVAWVEFITMLDTGAFGDDGDAPDLDMDNTVASIRAEALRFMESNDKGMRLRFHRAANGAQALAAAASDQLKGRARLVALTTSAAFSAVLLDSWDEEDVETLRNRAMSSVLQLLTETAAQRGANMAQSSPLFQHLLDWHAAAEQDAQGGDEEDDATDFQLECQRDILECIKNGINRLTLP